MGTLIFLNIPKSIDCSDQLVSRYTMVDQTSEGGQSHSATCTLVFFDQLLMFSRWLYVMIYGHYVHQCFFVDAVICKNLYYWAREANQLPQTTHKLKGKPDSSAGLLRSEKYFLTILIVGQVSNFI